MKNGSFIVIFRYVQLKTSGGFLEIRYLRFQVVLARRECLLLDAARALSFGYSQIIQVMDDLSSIETWLKRGYPIFGETPIFLTFLDL